MIDNFIERIAQRVFELIKPYLREKLEEETERFIIEIDEQRLYTQEAIEQILNKWQVSLANEVAGRFKF